MMILHEDKDSWDNFMERQSKNRIIQEQLQKHDYEYHEVGNHHDHHDRILKHNKHKKSKEEKRKEKLKKLLADPGIQVDTMHGLMIDAGSTGSRMHVYEFQKRVLKGEREISEAVSVSKSKLREKRFMNIGYELRGCFYVYVSMLFSFFLISRFMLTNKPSSILN